MKHKNLLLSVLVAVISFIAFDDVFSRIVRHLVLLQMETGKTASLYNIINDSWFTVSVALSLAIGVMVYKILKN